MMEKSFVMLKPDTVQRRLMGKVISRFEEKGLQIVAAKMLHISPETGSGTLPRTLCQALL